MSSSCKWPLLRHGVYCRHLPTGHATAVISEDTDAQRSIRDRARTMRPSRCQRFVACPCQPPETSNRSRRLDSNAPPARVAAKSVSLNRWVFLLLEGLSTTDQGRHSLRLRCWRGAGSCRTQEERGMVEVWVADVCWQWIAVSRIAPFDQFMRG